MHEAIMQCFVFHTADCYKWLSHSMLSYLEVLVFVLQIWNVSASYAAEMTNHRTSLVVHYGVSLSL